MDTNAEGTDTGDSTASARESSGKAWGGMTPQEAAQRSAVVRREKAEERRRLKADQASTVRQRLAIALSAELSVEDWRAVIKAARFKSDTAALARLADQAFGKPLPEEGGGNGEDIETMTRGERAALLARLRDEEERDGMPSGNASDPRDA